MTAQEPQHAFRLPAYEEIPDVGLYLEQTVRYLNEYLTPLGDAPVTASMVSNYVKMKLIPSPQRKQYSREQIAWLFFIAAGKSVVSLDHLRTLLTIQQNDYPPGDAYGLFREVMTAAVQSAFTGSSMPQPPADMPQAGRLLVNLACVAASKAYLSRCIGALSVDKLRDGSSS